MLFIELNTKMITLQGVFELISFKVLCKKLKRILKISVNKKVNKFKNKQIYFSVKIKKK